MKWVVIGSAIVGVVVIIIALATGGSNSSTTPKPITIPITDTASGLYTVPPISTTPSIKYAPPGLSTLFSTPQSSSVRYVIEGTATSVDVTLNNETGGTEQYSSVWLPRTYYYSDFSDNFLYISAQNNGETGSVIVSIYIDGTKVKTSTSSGAYVIASANYYR